MVLLEWVPSPSPLLSEANTCHTARRKTKIKGMETPIVTATTDKRERGEGADSILFFHDYKNTLNLKTNSLLCVIFQQAFVLCTAVKMCTFAVRHICFKPVVSFLTRYNGYYHKVLCCRPTYQLMCGTRTFTEVIKLKEKIL
jgi:hypothetical protein